MQTGWLNNLQTELKKSHRHLQAIKLAKKYAEAFSHAYLETYTVTDIVHDIAFLEQLTPDQPVDLLLYYDTQPRADKNSIQELRLRLYQRDHAIALAKILPILQNFDLFVDQSMPYEIITSKSNYWINDFSVNYSNQFLDIQKILPLLRQAFIKIYCYQASNDGFNRLIIKAMLSWREVMLLRAYAKYLRQIGFRLSEVYIQHTLVNHPLIAQDLIKLFNARHNPNNYNINKNIQLEKKIEQQIIHALENVPSLDEDHTIRSILNLIKATMRTNYFQPHEKIWKEFISFKLFSPAILEMPLPSPMYEIFVYSPRFEGIHLRNTKISRGGIRWSDRREDYRSEILGLMKAQVVKNAIIIPSGAKGGFVLKTLSKQASPADALQEAIFCYRAFIHGLIDITDNIQQTRELRPAQVICHDSFDPYLVVAADKGTANFSDIANEIAINSNFWLGDAFASGGSKGYDHKKIGITARGTWESIKRHFRELDINLQQYTITVIGIGDMSGDVFGNGMIYSNKIKLIAAFDHRHVFLDPNPDPKISYRERVRLFNLRSSSWADYNPKLISKGGGVFSRAAKSIILTPEIQTCLQTNLTEVIPNELIKLILTARVDLLYNGGIGTYVKSSTEKNTDVSDRANDLCRINGNQLRAKVVGEGGNLGFTQLGRIQYALNGGLINTDFIDNAGGVNCSDHEVNLKILLNHEINANKLTIKNRDKLLASLTQEVAELVINDNAQQALVMSFSAYSAVQNINLHTNYIKDLEDSMQLNRSLEFLPTQKEMLDRKAAGKGLTRPELAVLLAYTKINIKHAIAKSTLPQDKFFQNVIASAFPPSLKHKYEKTMDKHPLKADILATQLSNQIVNLMGITFVYRIQVETGAEISDIIRAYTIVSHIFEEASLVEIITSLDFKIPMPDQYDMLFNVRNLISLSTRWFLHHHAYQTELPKLINHYAKHIKTLEEIIPDLMSGVTKTYLDNLSLKFTNAGLGKNIARKIATYRAIYTTLNIIYVATKNNFDLIKTAQVYFASGERINLLWFRDQIINDKRDGHWNTLARLTVRDELDTAQCALTTSILKRDATLSVTALIDLWCQKNHRALKRWENLLVMLHGSTNVDYTMLFIAMRALQSLINATDFH